MALQVPHYDHQGGPAPLPGVRFRSDLPLDAFGGGDAAMGAFAQARGLSQDAARMAWQKQKEAKDQADADRLSEERRALNDWEYANVYDPKNGAMGKKGKDAFGVQDTITDGLDKFTSERAQNLTPEQRHAYEGMVDARRQHIRGTLANHVYQQTQEVHHGELAAGIKSSIERAAVDPSTVPLESSMVDDNARELARSQGLEKDATALMRAKAQSDLHAQVLDRMLSGGQDRTAKDYYAKYGSSIIGNDAERIQAKLQRGSTLGEAQRLNDVVMSYEPETLKDAVDHLHKIVDGDNLGEHVRAEAEGMVARSFAIQRAAKKDAQDKLFGDSAEQLRKGGDLSIIKKSDAWDRLDESDKEHLETMATRLAKTGSEFPQHNTPEKVAEFYSLSQESLQQMSKEDMLRYKSDMTEGEFISANKHWNSARNREDNATFKFNKGDEERILTGLKTFAEQIQKGDTLERISKNPKKSKEWEAFRKEAIDALESRFQEKKKNADPKERDQVITDLVINKVVHQDKRSALTKYGLYGLGTPHTAAPGAIAYGLGRLKDWWSGNAAPSITDEERNRIKQSVVRLTGSEPSDEKILMLKRAQSMGASPEAWQRLALE